jgi:predicted DCC family thiol-disulfide oxidoreductase YuxK
MNADATAEPARAIVLFDGVCNFCCASVQFIIARDPHGHFQFASQQSDTGRALLEKSGLPLTMETFVLIEDGTTYTRSAAGLKVARRLTFPWPLFCVGWLIPGFIRDAAYRWIAKNRYRWFGQKETCWIPSPEIRARFME